MVKRFPQRPESHQLEEASERFFIARLPKNWLSQKAGGDYGVDLKVDIFEGDNAEGLELLVQLKASAQPSDGDSETIRFQTSTYNLLWNKLQVVMLVKYVQAIDEAYWLLLSDVPEPDQSKKSLTVKIPKAHQFSTIDWKEIHNYVLGVHTGKIEGWRRSQLQD